MLARLAEKGFRVVTIVDPGVKHEPGLRRSTTRRVERDVLCRTEGGDVYIGEVWPGDTAFPDFVDGGGPRVVGRAQRRARALGRRRDLERHERAGDRPRSRPSAMRFDHGRVSHERFHNQYGLLMAMATTAGLLAAHARPAHVRPHARGLRRHPALRGELDGRQRLALGPPLAEHPDGDGPRALRPAVRRRRRRRLRRRLQRRAVPALDAVRDADAVLPQPLGDRQRRPVRVVVGRDDHRPRARRRSRCATGCCPTSTPRSSAASETGEPVQRPLVFDHQDDPAVRDLDDEYLLRPRPARRARRPRPGTTARQVYLPAGDWYDWHTGDALARAAAGWSRRRRWTASRSTRARAP